MNNNLRELFCIKRKKNNIKLYIVIFIVKNNHIFVNNK